jgi:hypothetical protein
VKVCETNSPQAPQILAAKCHSISRQLYIAQLHYVKEDNGENVEVFKVEGDLQNSYVGKVLMMNYKPRRLC